ncbi:hypothetical protein AcV7_008407 [Taiwanofungus camphoratus]|nr:hypothetical protein AcV7_008407 [Antrodia cinnamomea]
MAPRNATTPLSPLSPDPDQAPGLSRTPSFLKFTPQARHGLVRQPRRTRKLRGAPRRGPQDRLARTGASDPSSCRTCGSVSSMAEGAASVRLPAFSSVANLDVFALSNARGGRLGVRYPLGCQSAPAHDPNRQRAEVSVPMRAHSDSTQRGSAERAHQLRRATSFRSPGRQSERPVDRSDPPLSRRLSSAVLTETCLALIQHAVFGPESFRLAAMLGASPFITRDASSSHHHPRAPDPGLVRRPLQIRHSTRSPRAQAAARQLHPLALAPPPHPSPFRVPFPGLSLP